MKKQFILSIIIILFAGINLCAFGQTQNPRLRRGRGLPADSATIAARQAAAQTARAARAASTTTATAPTTPAKAPAATTADPVSIATDASDPYFPNLKCQSGIATADRGTANYPYFITTAADLIYLANRVNDPGSVALHPSGDLDANYNIIRVNVSYDKYFKIHDNVTSIDLAGYKWIPIGEQLFMDNGESGGSANENYCAGVFCGHFDGNNKKIYNMTITEESVRSFNDSQGINNYFGQRIYGVLGFFGVTSDNYYKQKQGVNGYNYITMEIKNVILVNASIKLNEWVDYNDDYINTPLSENSMEFGLLLAMPSTGNLEVKNCRVEGNIEFTDVGDYREIFGIGGMIGDMVASNGTTTVENCFSNVKINLGLTGVDNGTWLDGVGGFAGGFLADLVQDFENCGARVDMTLTGSVNNTTDIPTGGFIGSSQSDINFLNCYALGTIRVDGKFKGVSGFSNFTGGDFTFTNCYTATVVDLSATPSEPDNFGYWGIRTGGSVSCSNCHYLASWQRYQGIDSNWGWIPISTPSFDNVICANMLPHDSTYMRSAEMVDVLNPGGIINFHIDRTGFLKNFAYPILGFEPIVDPQIIPAGITVVIPFDYPADMTIPYYHPQLGIFLRDGGQFINNSNIPYVLTVERDLAHGNWECVGIPINDASTFGWLSNDAKFFDGTGSTTPTGTGEKLQNGVNWLDSINTKHNYLVAYPYNHVGNNWHGPKAYRTDAMTNGVGYMVWNGGVDHYFDAAGTFYSGGSNATGIGSSEATTVRYVGHVNKNGAPIPVNLPANYNAEKWYALANPYSYKLDIAEFIDDNASKIADASIYVWDVATQTYKKKTRLSDGSIDIYIWNGSVYTFDSNVARDFLKHGEGFMIKATSSGGTITFEDTNPYDGTQTVDY